MKAVALLIALIVALWVFSDAKKRGKSGGSAFAWALGTFLMLIIFLPLWLITRPKLPSGAQGTAGSKLCVYCDKYYDEASLDYCPDCGQKLKEEARPE